MPDRLSTRSEDSVLQMESNNVNLIELLRQAENFWTRINGVICWTSLLPVSRCGLAVRRQSGKHEKGLRSIPLRLSFLFGKVVVRGRCLVTLSLTVNETFKWLSLLPILMQESFWGWQPVLNWANISFANIVLGIRRTYTKFGEHSWFLMRRTFYFANLVLRFSSKFGVQKASLYMFCEYSPSSANLASDWLRAKRVFLWMR